VADQVAGRRALPLGCAVLALLAPLSCPAGGAPEADILPRIDGEGWRLLWRDEFAATHLDETRWTALEGPRKGGWWEPEAVRLDGLGRLVIRVFRKDGRYVSGAVTTRGKLEQRFGFFVMRAKLPREPGHWPAFWLTAAGAGRAGDEGRDGTEVDVMEKPWLDDRVQHALHWDIQEPSGSSASRVSSVAGVSRGFHTFAVWWKPEEYVFYVDGRVTWRSSAGGVSQVPQCLMVSEEVGAWAGRIAEARLPDRLVVDYVRVYVPAGGPAALQSTSTIISISTAQPPGSEAMPTALRACLPADSPKSSISRSVHP
jgi:beta-glucanase (GH16 family)